MSKYSFLKLSIVREGDELSGNVEIRVGLQ